MSKYELRKLRSLGSSSFLLQRSWENRRNRTNYFLRWTNRRNNLFDESFEGMLLEYFFFFPKWYSSLNRLKARALKVSSPFFLESALLYSSWSGVWIEIEILVKINHGNSKIQTLNNFDILCNCVIINIFCRNWNVSSLIELRIKDSFTTRAWFVCDMVVHCWLMNDIYKGPRWKQTNVRSSPCTLTQRFFPRSS